MNLTEIKGALSAILRGGGIEDANYVADVIISFATGLSRPFIHSHPEHKITEEEFVAARELAERRARREPLAYLLGIAYFDGLELVVRSDTLIPRPETEEMLPIAESLVSARGSGVLFADWCTGSGCIALALLTRHAAWRAYAVDASDAALEVARSNAKRCGVADRFYPVCCADAQNADIPRESLDFIIANPPYIPSGDIPSLMPDVRDYEPHLALDGGSDGLDVIRMLLRTAPKFLKPGGALICETAGGEQAERMMSSETHAGGAFPLKPDALFTDYRGIRRFGLWRK